MAHRTLRLWCGGSRQLLRSARTIAAIAMAALLVLPTVASSCDLDQWQTMPSACWKQGGAIFLQRISGAPPYGACGYYTNSYGHLVPRPCGDWRSETRAPPNGVTALCRDGTYSYSEHPHASGTCSHHGGVEHLR